MRRTTVNNQARSFAICKTVKNVLGIAGAEDLEAEQMLVWITFSDPVTGTSDLGI